MATVALNQYPRFKMRLFNTSMITLAFAAILPTCGAAAGAPAAADNWPQFRGPGARGISTNSHLPQRWSASENVAWKRDIPGRGWSSPIVWGGRLFCLNEDGVTFVVRAGD